WWADLSYWLTRTYGAFAVLGLGAALYMQIYRYRHVSSPIERQQAKWVASGAMCQALLAGVSDLTVAASSMLPGATLPWWAPVGQFLWWLSLDIIPLALTLAVLRYRLFDLDALIRRTLVYGTLTAILGAVYIAVILAAQSAMRVATGQA